MGSKFVTQAITEILTMKLTSEPDCTKLKSLLYVIVKIESARTERVLKVRV